jgi:hypothetical protein
VVRICPERNRWDDFASPLRPRFNRRMPTLTRKRVNDRPATWHVHYAGVRVGVIVERSGTPPSSHQWQWCCGFYPGGKPGDDRHGTAASFEVARAAFEAAWREYLPKRFTLLCQPYTRTRDFPQFTVSDS